MVKGWAKEVNNSIGMKLVRIPAGKFKMGSPKGEKNRSEDEEQHEVEITKEFWLGMHEVTQKEFKAVMGYNPSYFSRDGEGKTGVTYSHASRRVARTRFRRTRAASRWRTCRTRKRRRSARS